MERQLARDCECLARQALPSSSSPSHTWPRSPASYVVVLGDGENEVKSSGNGAYTGALSRRYHGKDVARLQVSLSKLALGVGPDCVHTAALLKVLLHLRGNPGAKAPAGVRYANEKKKEKEKGSNENEQQSLAPSGAHQELSFQGFLVRDGRQPLLLKGLFEPVQQDFLVSIGGKVPCLHNARGTIDEAGSRGA